MRVERRTVTVDVIEHGDETTARAALDENDRAVHGTGDARRKRTDFDVPDIGEDLAVGRALIDLGTRLIEGAQREIGAVEGRVVGRPAPLRESR